MTDRCEPNKPVDSGDCATAEVTPDANARLPEEISGPMREVHAPHEAIHTWKSFFIHIATIVIGLFIAVAIEQSVEAYRNGHEAAALRQDLRAESQQTLLDARGAEAAQIYELDWLGRRIQEVQAAILGHQPLASREPYNVPGFASPDIPIWRSAKAGGRISLLSKGK